MLKFEKMQVHKWCELTETNGKWVTTHVKYLRSGNRFRAKKWGGGEYTIFLATSDPYLRLPEKVPSPSLLEVAMNPEAIEMFAKPVPPFWTINTVKER